MSEEALTSEAVDEINRILRALIAEGEAALPAIRQFLESGEDLSFIGLMDDADLVGYDSLRIGLFDVLRQIGGPEAEAIMLGELQKTRDPPEIATLAEFMEEMAPGEYRQDALDTALATLDLASEIQLNAKDVGSLFYVLQAYGDANVVSDLEQNLDQWGHYAMVSLAVLSEGEGIPALIDLVNERPEQNPDDPPVQASSIYTDKSLFALQMLAQVAAQQPNAHAALVEQTGSNRIPDSLWPKISLALAGQYRFQNKKPGDNFLAQQVSNTSSWPKSYPHVIAVNGQVIYIRNRYGLGKLPPEETDARIGLIDELISVSQSVAANRALNHARSMLMANKANK